MPHHHGRDILSLVVALSLSENVCAQSSEELLRLPNLNYVGQGYDILKGNPHPTAADSASLLDPGWRSPIFELEFPLVTELTSESTFLSEGVTYTVPRGVAARACPACSFEFQSTDLLTSNSYKDSLRVAVKADFKGWGASFKASTDFQRVQQRYEEENTKFVESSGVCTFYCARMNAFAPPALLDNFRVAVERLPLEFEADAYYGFISEFGSHYSRGVTMGGLFGEQTEITSTAVRTLEELGIDIQVAASYSGVSASGGVDVLTNIQKEQASNFSKESTTSREFSYGGRPVFRDAANDTSGWLDSVIANPIPLDSELDMISNLLTDINFPEDENIDVRQYNLVVALSEYCGRLENAGDIDCVDREFAIERIGLVGADIDSSRVEPDDPKLEANWDDGSMWQRMGQPPLTGIQMWFDQDGLATIRGLYERDDLHYHSETEKWEDAQAICLNEDSRLVSILNSKKNDRFTGLIDRLHGAGKVPIRNDGSGEPERIWIGLNDMDVSTAYVWEDLNSVSFKNYLAGEPNGEFEREDCVEYLTHLGTWNDVPCSLTRPFVCQFPREHGASDTISVPLEFNLAQGEYIKSVEVCDPESLGSLQFTTKSFIGEGTTTSQVFSYGLTRENTECFTTGGYHRILDNSVIRDVGIGYSESPNNPKITSWEACQQLCHSEPECAHWVWRDTGGEIVYWSTCLLLKTADTTTFISAAGRSSCPGGECRDCSSETFQPVDSNNCQTFEFSDRLGLVHLSGANTPVLSDGTGGRLQSLGFHGFEEYSIEVTTLDIPENPRRTATSSALSIAPIALLSIILQSLLTLEFVGCDLKHIL